MATRTNKVVGIRLEPAVIEVYERMAATVSQGARDLGLPAIDVTPTALMRDLLLRGAVRYQGLMDSCGSPTEVVRALQTLTTEEVAS